MGATMTVPPAPNAGRLLPTSDQQLLAAQRILDLHPELTLGEALGLLAVAFEALGVIGGDA